MKNMKKDLTCVVKIQEGIEIAPKRRQLTLRRTDGSTGVSRKYRPRAMSIPRRSPGRQYQVNITTYNDSLILKLSSKCVSLFPILRIESGAETSVYGIKSSLHNLQNIFSSSQIFLFPSFLDFLDPPPD